MPDAGSGVGVSKDKKARQAALREFLIAMPGAFDAAGQALGRMVWLGVIALALVAWSVFFARPDHPAQPVPVGKDDNPSGALFVRDLGRLADGRHTFDLVYQLVVHNPGGTIVRFDGAASERLSLADPASEADVIDLGAPPGALRPATGRWHELIAAPLQPGQPNRDILPGHWQVVRAHYRIKARPEQSADVAIAYELHHDDREGFHNPMQRREPKDMIAHDEEVQLGVVVRAHCPLGVKIVNGEVRSLCGS
jgi:hypothetical protein